MPQDNVQEYVSLSEDKGMSLVVTINPYETCRIIAEGRYVFEPSKDLPEVAFMVDEKFQGRGIATFLLEYLIDIGRERGVQGFQADILLSNESMLHVFDKLPYVVHKNVSQGVVSIHFRFDELKETM